MSNSVFEYYPVKIRKFDVSTMKPDSVVVAIGRRRSGKSTLIRDILYQMRIIPRGYVMSGTEHASPFFSQFVPPKYTFSGFRSHILQNLIEVQKKKVAKEIAFLKETAVSRGLPAGQPKPTNETRQFLVMDDLLAEAKEWTKDENVRDLFFNGRHYNIFYTLSLQSMQGIPSSFKGNADYIFIFKESSPDTRKKINQVFGFGSYDDFSSLMDACTNDYECLVIDTTSKTNKVEDMVFFYKARTEIPTFRMGESTPRFWDP